MQKKVTIVTESEYNAWLSKQKSYYETVIKPTLAEK
jgi:heme/copper-type cytochrome/quinol oxidase subunit 2